jgi:hypothetical protein
VLLLEDRHEEAEEGGGLVAAEKHLTPTKGDSRQPPPDLASSPPDS